MIGIVFPSKSNIVAKCIKNSDFDFFTPFPLYPNNPHSFTRHSKQVSLPESLLNSDVEEY